MPCPSLLGFLCFSHFCLPHPLANIQHWHTRELEDFTLALILLVHPPEYHIYYHCHHVNPNRNYDESS